ncbi:MAG TPA: hypothetical protein VHZ24_00145 [Pirellulales bacterium]|jgi:predicted RNase H-like nuclease (RuvC/YqgF family)|nr:hypothetical protein [Pirellulales bacterium]
MNRSLRALVAGCVAMVIVGATLAVADPVLPNSAVSGNADSSFALRYAEATLKLAKMDLQKALDVNKLVPNTFSPAAVEPLQQAVDVAQQRYEQVKNATGDPLYELYVRSEEGSLRCAQADYNKALAANQRFKGSVMNDELERLRLTVEVARLRYDKARDSSHEAEVSSLQWQVEQLREEVQHLRARVEQLRKIN